MKKHIYSAALLLSLLATSCKDDFLVEKPLAIFSPEITLTTKAGFESAIVALHSSVREEMTGRNHWVPFSMVIGTDVAATGDEVIQDFKDYRITLTPQYSAVDYWWEWAYLKVIPKANTIIDYAGRPTAKWATDAERNAILAEARFLRAYAYNALVNLYGGVPIIDKLYTEPKLDFARATRKEVLDFVQEDLAFAGQWLPKTTTQDGRIVKAAADHLLSEVYISQEKYDKAIASATAVIDDGLYKLMTQRFGRYANQPGDAYADLFRDSNQNRKSGNMETIWALQMEFQTPGGGGTNDGNIEVRAWGAAYHRLKDPNGKNGMYVADSLGRGVGWIRPTNYWTYEIWTYDRGDMRNSPFNIRRTWYYNEPSSAFFRKPVAYYKGMDTLSNIYDMPRKVEGEALAGATSGKTFKDHYQMRLAETYLLRAEAYLRKSDKANALKDINTVRNRAMAKPATIDQLSIDYILDERARELMVEEPRRRTLTRMGKLVERVKKYNFRSGSSIQPFHELFPIPQKAIDANINAKLEQNPGY